MTIEEAIKYGKEKLHKKQDVHFLIIILLQYVLKKDKIYIITHNTDNIEEKQAKQYMEEIEKLKNGYPIQYITGNQEFMGFNYKVSEDVLIPQPDTEILVEEVIKISKSFQNKNNDILDLCCGSGCIGISIAKILSNTNVTLSDISKKAIKIAKQNAEKLNVKVDILQSDLFENINKQYEIIVSNPPYIRTNIIKNLPIEVQNEPIIALDGGEDGLIFYKEIIEEAPKYLKNGGYLCLEIGFDQKQDVETLMQKNFEYINTVKDLSSNDRVVIGRKKEL